MTTAPSEAHKKTSKSQHTFAPAERAQIKRTGVTGGNLRLPAPTHPLYMSGGRGHVSTLALLGAPKSNAQGEQSSARGRWVETHEVLLRRIHCTCQGRHATSALWPR